MDLEILTLPKRRIYLHVERSEFMFDVRIIGSLELVEFLFHFSLRVRLIFVGDFTSLTDFCFNGLRLLLVEHICDELSDFNDSQVVRTFVIRDNVLDVQELVVPFLVHLYVQIVNVLILIWLI